MQQRKVQRKRYYEKDVNMGDATKKDSTQRICNAQMFNVLRTL